MTNTEKTRLDNIAADPKYAEGPNEYMVDYSFRVFQRHMKNGPTLEMGPAEGIMTKCLVDAGYDLTVLEGSGQFCKSLRKRYPRIEVIESLFEKFTPKKKFSNIILGHVLEHVSDPVAILKKAGSWLVEDGRIFAAVPNSRSIHRQAGVLLGQLVTENALNDADRMHGHRRVYNPEDFRGDFHAAGLCIDIFGGYWLKPLSNAQISEHWSKEILYAFMKLGERYPDIAAEIYVIASNNQGHPFCADPAGLST